MKSQEQIEILKLISGSKIVPRGYSCFFEWRLDRDEGELGVVISLAESLEMDGKTIFTDLKSRGRSNDPPDCEALNIEGERIAIEVTELVDKETIKAYKSGDIHIWSNYDKNKLINSIEERISKKDSRYPYLKEPPYKGGYILVIHTDEPMLDFSTVKSYLQWHEFKKPTYVTQAFLLLSYDPGIKNCPHYELRLGK